MGKRVAHVLVVDDNPVNLRVCRLILERSGHVVETDTSPVAVLSRVASKSPDVLITDLMMPLLDGIELTRQIRVMPTGRNLPIIVLTARGEESDQDRAMEAGATLFLTKPVSSGTLTAAVNDALATAQPGT